MSRGWEKLESHIVHKNPYYFIRGDKVRTPTGTDGEYFYMDGSNSVMVIVEDEEKKLSLVGQARYPIGNKYSLEFVSGGIGENESALEAAKRELVEEAGLRAQEWESLGSFNPLNGISSEETYVYLARGLEKVSVQYDETEDITYKQANVQEILEMVKDGTITCGMTLAALQKYLLFIGKI